MLSMHYCSDDLEVYQAPVLAGALLVYVASTARPEDLALRVSGGYDVFTLDGGYSDEVEVTVQYWRQF